MNANTLVAYLLESGGYSKSCTLIDLPPEQADFLVSWGKEHVPDDVLHQPPDDDTLGRETEMHVTVLYGIDSPTVPDRLREIAASTKPFKVMLGKVSLFRNDDYDVVKVEVESEELRTLRARIEADIPNKQTFPDYNPHATVAYVKKGTCDHLEGSQPFASEGAPSAEFVAPFLKFAGKGEEDRVKETLPFTVPVRKKKKVQENEGDLLSDKDDLDDTHMPIYWVVKLEREGFPTLYSSEFGSLKNAPVRLSRREADKLAEYQSKSFPGVFKISVEQADDQTQMYWQGKLWPQEFQSTPTDQGPGGAAFMDEPVNESIRQYRVAFQALEPFPHTVHKVTADVCFEGCRVYIHGVPRLKARVVEVATGRVLRSDYGRFPLHESQPFDGLPFPMQASELNQFKREWRRQYGVRRVVADSVEADPAGVDDIDPKDELSGAGESYYAVSYLAWPLAGAQKGGWSKRAKHRPQPVPVYALAKQVEFKGKSVYVDGVRRLRLNLKEYPSGRVLRMDYPNLPFVAPELNPVADTA